jgi:hypothetical protein
LPFLQSQPNTCITAEIWRAFRFLRVLGKLGYCSFVSLWTGSEKLFAKLWNSESVEVQDMWHGTVLFRVLQEVRYKGEIQLLDAEGEAYIYIQQKFTKTYSRHGCLCECTFIICLCCPV